MIVFAEPREASPPADQVVHAVSHELNTAMTTVLGNAHLLRARGDSLDSGVRRAALTDLEQNAERLFSAIQNMLLMARLEMGEMPALEPTVLPKVLQELIDRECTRRPERKVGISLQPIDYPVAMDRALFRVILRNLIENAWLFSESESDVSFVAVQDGDVAVIEVLDRGSGLLEGEEERIFEPFYRSPAVRDHLPGLGIGLTVARKLAELHGGTLTARGRAGGGACMSLTLPLVRPGD